VTPVNQPLINSVYDIVEQSDIQLVVRKASTLNRLISVNSAHIFLPYICDIHHTRFVTNKDPNATGILQKLRKKLDSFPNSECHMISECINMIKPGSRKTFADVIMKTLEK
jgi:translation initiation factor 6 (eIF-6)